MGPEITAALFGLIGGTFGVIFSTVASGIDSAIQRRHDRRVASYDGRKEIYFDSTAILNDMLNALRTFQSANSGMGMTRGKRKSILPFVGGGYRKSDKESADAIDELFRAKNAVQLQTHRMRIIGTQSASESFSECYRLIEEYMTGLAEQIQVDPYFSYEDSDNFVHQYSRQVQATVLEFSKDLKSYK